MTREQISKIDAQCANGFSFNFHRWLTHNEKGLQRIIELKKDEKVLKVTLGWTDEVVHDKNQYGITYPTFTGQVIPSVHCSVWYKCQDSTFWTSSGLGAFKDLKDKPSKRKVTKKLCELTHEITDEMIASMLDEQLQKEFQQAI